MHGRSVKLEAFGALVAMNSTRISVSLRISRSALHMCGKILCKSALSVPEPGHLSTCLILLSVENCMRRTCSRRATGCAAW